jgi:putative FmdB family regulatory protein
MPIFEFRCIDCNECFEILVMNRDENVDLQCPKCASQEVERIMSKSCFAMGDGGGKGQGVAVQDRSCSSGSCTTWEIPGHSR